MNNFEEYLRQGEPDKIKKAKIWKTAIGLQQVDGLNPSNYLIETAKQNIEGYISLKEVSERIDNYYKQSPIVNKNNREEEADKVSTRITEILSEQSFNFSPTEYLGIHRRLFQDIYTHAGKIRDYNIIKKEWILDGDSVLYASADNLKETLEYDLKQERDFSYKNLTEKEVIEHLANFVSYLWQIHVFGEGNTRTTAIFLIKYLRKIGFKEVNNDLFEQYSWYFRNSLVRANYENISNNIHPTPKYLIYFLSNLLLGTNYILKNRELHVLYNDTVKRKLDTVNDTILNLIKKDKNITANQIAEQLNISLSTVKRRLKTLKEDNKIVRKGSDKTGYWKIR